MSKTTSTGPGARTSERQVDLPRGLGAFSLAGVTIGLMVGSGIFRIPSTVAGLAGTVGAIMLVWVLGGLISLFGALALAEMSGMYPQTGGVYVFLRETYGRRLAFVYGWTRIVVLQPSTLGAVALILASYLRTLIPYPAGGERWVAAGVLTLLMVLNYRSTTGSVLVENVTSTAKVLALAGMAVVVLLLVDRGSGALAVGSADWGITSISGVGLALVIAMWSYSGWASSCSMVGEVRDPGRMVPRAFIGAITAVTAAYLLVNVAYLLALPMDRMVGTEAVASDAMSVAVGPVGAGLVAVLVVVSTFGALNASMLFGPRIFFAMARDGLLPRGMGDVHPEHRTPYLATVFAAVLGVAFISLRSFEELVQGFVLGAWPFYAAAAAGVFVMRRRRPNAERPYRAWGHPWTTLLFVLLIAGMVGNSLIVDPGPALFAFGLIALGVPLHWVVERFWGEGRR